MRSRIGIGRARVATRSRSAAPWPQLAAPWSRSAAPRSRIAAGVVALMACGGPAGAPAPAPSTTAEPAAPTGLAPAIVVVLHHPLDDGDSRKLAELRGLVTIQLEAGLADLTGVVPLIENVPLAPGLAGRLEADAARWRLAVRVTQTKPDAMGVALELCPASGDCTSLDQRAGDDPTPAVATLLGELARALDRPPPAADAWTRTPSKDRYARLIVGRSAATWYRLLPAVSAEHLHDRRFDPVERAIFIDPRMSFAHWVAGRRRFDARDYAGARIAFSRASLAAPERVLHLADEAAALEALGQLEAARAAWDAIRARAPGDGRFVLPRARVLVAMERTQDAAAELDALGPRFQGDPQVLALRVAIAERAGSRPEDQALLARWQAADPTSPEPVRRRIALFVRHGALEDAHDLLPELEKRGAASEAAQLGLALATSLGQLDEARAAAERLGLGSVAAALALREGLEKGGDPAALEPLAADPIARVAIAERFLGRGDAARALRTVDAVLVTEPWLPEALTVRAQALDALGRADDAAVAWAAATSADPGRTRTSTST